VLINLKGIMQILRIHRHKIKIGPIGQCVTLHWAVKACR